LSGAVLRASSKIKRLNHESTKHEGIISQLAFSALTALQAVEMNCSGKACASKRIVFDRSAAMGPPDEQMSNYIYCHGRSLSSDR
jgi:hypothetical protein